MGLFVLEILTCDGEIVAGRSHVERRDALTARIGGDQADRPRHLRGGMVGIVGGAAGALYGGLDVGQSIHYAMDTVRAVPRNVRPDLIRSRIRSLVLLCALGSAVLATTLLSALGRQSAAPGVHLPRA